MIEISLHAGGSVAISGPDQVLDARPIGDGLSRVVVAVDGVEYVTSWVDPAALRRACGQKLERIAADLAAAEAAAAEAAELPVADASPELRAERRRQVARNVAKRSGG